MPEQARNLVRSMKNEPTVDFENDWKFITVFIGGNDLCSGCLYEESSPEQYIRFLEKAIQILHDEVFEFQCWIGCGGTQRFTPRFFNHYILMCFLFKKRIDLFRNSTFELS